MRIVITGSPLAGKTTLAGIIAKITGVPVFHTDDVKDLEWSEASQAVSGWLAREGSWIIEGVTVPRALRKWQMNHPDEPPPLDWFIYLPKPRSFLGIGQETMRKQIHGLAETQKDWIGERWIEL